MQKIAIIGAGPAGIYTSLFLKEFPGEVHLFEQNSDIGEKLKMTGGGRMNVTNKHFGVEQFSSSEKRPLLHLFKNPWFSKAEDLLKSLEVEYVWEKDRAILKSQNAIAEVARLKSLLLEQKNCSLGLNCDVQNIVEKDGSWEVQYLQHGAPMCKTFDKIILAGGGMYRVKDLKEKEKIYHLPISLGHKVTDEVKPSLSPLIFKDTKLRELKGIAFEGKLIDQKSKKSVQNDMIITHFGLSGPAVLDFTSLLSSDTAALCFLPGLEEVDFRNQLSSLRQGRQSLRKFLWEYLPKRVGDFHLTQISDNKSINFADLTKTQLECLLQNLYHYPIQNFQAPSYPSSWTTKGGVKLSEVNVNTLESKKAPGVHFVGEILDCDGLCGGYNISFTLVSGKIVAEAITAHSMS